MVLYPGHELIARECSSGQFQHNLLLFIHLRVELVSIQEEKDIHGGMSHPLVSIHERVVEHKRKAKCRGF
jgi:hypothetical protein